MEPSVLHETKEGVILHVRVSPNAAQSKIIGLYENALKISLQAPPVDGAANQELIRFLANMFGFPKSQIKIIRGETSRTKQILFHGIHHNDIDAKIAKYL